MTQPMFSVTLDERRYYEWPEWPDLQLPSITTHAKNGVPKPVLQTWAIKRVAQTALEYLDLLLVLKGKRD